jgi:hypothetical protein
LGGGSGFGVLQATASAHNSKTKEALDAAGRVNWCQPCYAGAVRAMAWSGSTGEA